jgi:hypothetical protein
MLSDAIGMDVSTIKKGALHVQFQYGLGWRTCVQ